MGEFHSSLGMSTPGFWACFLFKIDVSFWAHHLNTLSLSFLSFKVKNIPSYVLVSLLGPNVDLKVLCKF